jgi:hypothetical protein
VFCQYEGVFFGRQADGMVDSGQERGAYAFIVLYAAQPEVPEDAVRVDGARVVEQNRLFRERRHCNRRSFELSSIKRRRFRFS